MTLINSRCPKCQSTHSIEITNDNITKINDGVYQVYAEPFCPSQDEYYSLEIWISKDSNGVISIDSSNNIDESEVLKIIEHDEL